MSEVKIYHKMPKGYRAIKGASNPNGAIWINNGAMFKKSKNGSYERNPKYKQGLLIKDKKTFTESKQSQHLVNSNTKKLSKKPATKRPVKKVALRKPTRKRTKTVQRKSTVRTRTKTTRKVAPKKSTRKAVRK